MRLILLSCAAFAVCSTSFVTAQSVPDDLRAEIRRIVREELRAALQDMHAGAAAPATGVAQVVQVEGKPIVLGKSVAVGGGAPAQIDLSQLGGTIEFGKVLGSDLQIEVNGQPLQIGSSKGGEGGQLYFSISRGDKATACCESSPKPAAAACCESGPTAVAGACCENATAAQAGPEAGGLVIVGEPGDAKDEKQAKADKKKAKKAKKKAEKEAEKEAEKQGGKSSN